jgi:hypothetical protein
MLRPLVLAATLVLPAGEPGPADADVRSSRSVEVGRSCGGDAFSFAEVAPPGRFRGPVSTVPDTLCADLERTRPSPFGSLGVVVEPRGRTDEPMARPPRRRAD